MYTFQKAVLALSAALILGPISSAAAESWDPVPGDRNSYPIAAQSHFVGRSVYEARAQVVAPYGTRLQWESRANGSQPWGPISSSSSYGGGF